MISGIKYGCIVMATLLAFSVSGKMSEDKSFLIKTGGLIDVPPRGCVIVVNCQKRIPDKVFDSQVQKLLDITQVNIKRVYLPKFDFTVTPKEAKKNEGASAAIFIVDSADLPISLIAPEGNWGIVNIFPLYTKGVDLRLINSRAQTEFMRVTLLSLGAWLGDGASVLKHVSRLDDLDSLSERGITLLELRDIMNHMLSLGITRATSVTYKQAYKEGWAPEPTNDFQRAVIEQIKAEKERGPTNPIEIPMPKKK